jgi:hypothetical protein
MSLFEMLYYVIDFLNDTKKKLKFQTINNKILKMFYPSNQEEACISLSTNQLEQVIVEQDEIIKQKEEIIIQRNKIILSLRIICVILFLLFIISYLYLERIHYRDLLDTHNKYININNRNLDTIVSFIDTLRIPHPNN